nr:GNAT family N-acetyltransferase [Clostridium perfringens]
MDELERRTIFIENNNGEKIATFTAWWRYTGERRHPFMEWVAVKPEYQGKGLGKALISEGVKLMIAIEGDCDMYIPTQTWSYKAIRLYRWAGFEFETEEKFPGGIKNETLEGIKVIKNLI